MKKICKLCKRPIDGDGEYGRVCEHKHGEETKIIINYQNQIHEIEKKFEIDDKSIDAEDDIIEIQDERLPPNSGTYMSIFKKSSVSDDNSVAGMYMTIRPLLNDLENQGLIRHSNVLNIAHHRTLMMKKTATRDILMKCIREAQK